MTVSAQLVKTLRERSGAGMMACKKALTETNGDIDAAIDLMRKSGVAAAGKRAARIAAEGVVVVDTKDAYTVLCEINCETDFVARSDDFRRFVDTVVAHIHAHAVDDTDTLAADEALSALRTDTIAKIGENITVRRMQRLHTGHSPSAAYIHGEGRIGVVVQLDNGDDALAHDIAMHVAAMAPRYIDATTVPAAEVDKERAIVAEQAEQSGKPAAIIEKMIAGRIRKFTDEITIVGQPFVKDQNITVGALLAERGATVSAFVRYEVGEGIEKKTDDFVAEVMAQVGSS